MVPIAMNWLPSSTHISVNNMYKLSQRLETIAGLVPEKAKVADIGADHGYLSIFIEKTKNPEKIIACDINQKPLLSAIGNIKKTDCKKIETRLSDGLQNIKSDEVDTVIIAGMGGEVISGIIGRAEWLKNEKYTLLLQPMTAAAHLRRFLYQNGFEIVFEKAVFDTGKIYSVIKAQYVGVLEQRNEAFFYCGKLNPNEKADADYIKKQLRIAKECRDSLKGVSEGQEKYNYYKNLVEELEKILGEV